MAEITKAPHIGQLLRSYIKGRAITQAEWAKKQGVKPHFISRYLARPEIKISTLFTISLILNNNFFREIAEMLPAEMPSRNNKFIAEMENLKKENERLKSEVELLKDLLKR